ncbi:MAG TPA: class II aldolase/adducin family protein [Spirochaetota bacterium]|nr:class II aldolase/adducin family protein [Spirochaetota bacterium]
MKRLLEKYDNKLTAQGLCDSGAPLIGGLDARLEWNRDDDARGVIEKVIGGMNINSILFARPAEPFFSILDRLAAGLPGGTGAIRPEDSETRTFLHDIPILPEFDPEIILSALRRRKGAFVRGHGIVTYGTVSPEQAFITFSSICFSAYVKFFSDLYYNGIRDSAERELRDTALGAYKSFVHGKKEHWDLQQGPFTESGSIYSAIAEAGRLVVDFRLVDSFFGNISYRTDDTIYISQTGSSLDELPGCVDPCPVDGSSCAAVTASSEYSAHKEIYLRGGSRAILHGHPKFSVIMSMLCDKKDCENRGQCHIKCTRERFINDIPVVPGEVGTGRYGLCNTLPPAVTGRRGAIVYGHGLFTTGQHDFHEAFSRLLDIELMCIDEYEGLVP